MGHHIRNPKISFKITIHVDCVIPPMCILMIPVVSIQPKQPEKVSGQKWDGFLFGQCGSMTSKKLCQKFNHVKSSLLIAQNNPEKQKDCSFTRRAAAY